MRKIEKFLFVITFFVLIVGLECKKSSTPPEDEDNSTGLTGEYLGQEPPGMEPVRFAPAGFLANSAWFWHGSPVFSPDGTEMFFGKYLSNDQVRIYYTKIQNGWWIIPRDARFTPENITNNPVYSLDGDKLFFVAKNLNEVNIYETTRTEAGWSVPVTLDIPIPSALTFGWQFSIASNGNIYLELWPSEYTGPPDLYKITENNGSYSEPEPLGNTINTEHNEFSPFISPDESYIIFVSNRPGGYGMHDLYISFRDGNSWTEAVNMGSRINTPSEDIAPYLTPDRQYLFFTTQKAGDQGYNAYWVSAQIIEDLRPAELK